MRIKFLHAMIQTFLFLALFVAPVAAAKDILVKGLDGETSTDIPDTGDLSDDYLATIRGEGGLFATTTDSRGKNKEFQDLRGVILWDEVEEYNSSRVGTKTEQNITGQLSQRR